MKNNKGITLVALVITIIVLLILAGVSISMVVGENGVLNRATNASEKTSDADVETALKVAVSGVQGDFIGIWNEDNSLDFMECVKAGDEAPELDDQVWLHADGYKIKLGTESKKDGKTDKYTDCRIQKLNSDNKPIGSVYSFDLVRKSQYGADVEGFARTDLAFDTPKPAPESPSPSGDDGP